MKIIQVLPFFGFGGAETMCESLIYELKSLGHDVIAVSMYDYHSDITDRLERSGVGIRYLNKKSGLDLSLISKMKRLFKAERPDVVHTHLYAPKYAFPAAIACKVPHKIHTIHSIATKECGFLDRKQNKLFFKLFGIVPVALSELVQDTVVKEYHLAKNKVPVVFNGVNLSKCIQKTDYSTQEKFKVIHIGSFQSVKNHAGLIDSFKIFNSKYPCSELDLIGYGELEDNIKNYVAEQGLLGCVNFLGKQSNVAEFLNKADVFCLPSFYEGIPMSIIEAMGTGLPIVATAVGGVPDMLTNDIATLTQVDTNEIAAAFERYYLDASLREKHGQAVLERALAFSSQIMAEKYLEIYNN